MAGLIEWWAALGVLSGVTHSAHAYALVSALHVLGIALLVGPILLADLALLGIVRGLDGHAVTILRRTARIGLALAVAMGILLAAARPHEYIANRVFLAKLCVIAIGIANAVRVEARSRTHSQPHEWDQTTNVPGARFAATLSLAAWLLALALGRWIAFV